MTPDAVFGDENFCAGMFQKLPLFFGLELEVQRDKCGAAEKNRVGGNQPLGLIGHDDGDAVAGADGKILQRFCEGKSFVLEIAIGEALLFFAAVGFDQADFGGPGLQSVAESFAHGIVSF